MFSHHNMSDNTEIDNNYLSANNASNVETNETNEITEPDSQLNNPSKEIENILEEKDNNENNSESSDAENLEKMILSTGIRVGTPVKTKSMSRYIVRANPEGLYILNRCCSQIHWQNKYF